MNNQFLANHHFLTLSVLSVSVLSVLVVMSMTACGSHSSSDDDILANNKATNNKATNNNAIQSPVTPTNPNPTTPTNKPRVWLESGGNATVAYDENAPFLTLIPNLDISQLSGVSQGRELFITNWQPTGQGRALFDGVGPLYNAVSCTSCHAQFGRVVPYHDDGTTTDGVLFRIGDNMGEQHPIWGGQLQPNVIPNNIGLLAEGSVKVSNQTDAQGRNFWQFNFTPADSNQSLGKYRLGARIAPQLLGVGLLDLVPQSAIEALADEHDSNHDGISGRVHWVYEENQKRIGKFGWKAINSSLRTQNATAMSQDMGLTTPVHIESSCTNNQPLCLSLPLGGMPEVSDSALTAVVDFMTALSVPARRISNQSAFDRGADLFDAVGCGACHNPTFTTGTSPKFGELSNQVIYPYTDLLLHDMGAGLDDGVKEINAQSYEWRTPPLWGIGIVAKNPDARFLHDGRARTLEEAISWHGGEAQSAHDKFQQLSKREKADFMSFLNGI